MTYFSPFPKVDYFFGDNVRSDQFTNMAAFVNVLDQIGDESTLYQYYNVRDGERPEVVSNNLYGTTDLYWSFFLMNDDLRRFGWPLSYQSLEELLERDLPGSCLTFFGSTVGAETGFVQHNLVNKFPIGSTIFGTQSGATGVVYDRNLMLGQLYVRRTSVAEFVRNEVVVDSITQSPNYSMTSRIVYAPASLAPRHYVDGDGTTVDVDFSSDFRGRATKGHRSTGRGLRQSGLSRCPVRPESVQRGDPP